MMTRRAVAGREKGQKRVYPLGGHMAAKGGKRLRLISIYLIISEKA